MYSRRILFAWFIGPLFATAAAAQNLVVDRTSLSITAAPGTFSQLVLINVTSSGASLSGLNVSSTPDWLRVALDGHSTPAQIGMLCDARQLSEGTYQGTITVTATSPVSTSVSIPVTLTVGQGGATNSFTVDRASLTFTGQSGGAAPASQTLNVSSSPSGMTFTVSSSTTDGGTWLQVSPTSGTAPAAITVAVNITGLSARNYTGTITFTPASGSPVPVTVSLNLAAASGLNVNTTNLQFSYVVGGATPAAQAINVTGPSTALNFNVTISLTDGSGWLSATPLTGTTPQELTVTTTPTGLTAGVYHGKIIVSGTDTGTGSIDVSVTLTVSSSGAIGLQTDVPTLSFSARVNGSAPASQQISVISNPSGLGFTVSTATSSGGTWLQATPANATAPAAVTVSVSTTGLSSGTYSGTVTLTPSTGTVVTVSVSLAVTSGAAITASVTSLKYYYTIGAKIPAAQSFNVSGVTASFNTSVTTTDVSGWLAALPVSGVMPNLVTVTVSPVGYASGVYRGNVTITLSDNSASLDIPVILTISSGPLLIVEPTAATFVYQPGGVSPASQTVTVDTSAYVLSFTAAASASTGGSWLSVSPNAGTTPQNLTISVNPKTLSPGTYLGTVTIAAPATANSSITISIQLVVTNSVLVPGVLNIPFNYHIGGTNQVLSQSVDIASSGGDQVPGTATAITANCSTSWLQVSPAAFTTPTTISATLVPTGLSQPKSCAGVILLATSSTSTMISVDLAIATTRLVNITPLAVTLYATSSSQSTANQTIEVSTTDNTPIPFVVTVSGGSWLSVTRNDTPSKSTLTATANPASLGVGTYSGTISISSSALPYPRLIPVTLVVTPATLAAANPATLLFTQTVGGTPPPIQTVKLSTIGGTFPFTASVLQGMPGSGVLTVAPGSGSTGSTTLSIGILPNSLVAGSYDAAVVVNIPAADSKPLTIPITLTVANIPKGAGIGATPQWLTFNVQQGAAAPAAQQIKLTSTEGSFNIAVANASKWLGITPNSGTTPLTLAVSVDPSGLTAGEYKDTVVIQSIGILADPINVPVHLVVSPIPVVLPQISAIANAASNVRGPIAPGEMVAIKGKRLGPEAGVKFTLTSNGTVDTTLGGTQVFFDDFAAPLLFVSSGQINAIIPYEIAGRSRVQAKVVANGVASDGYTIQVGASAPGIFTVAENGRGPGAILNADNGLNSLLPPALPAKRGSVVQVFGTGEGLLQPAVPTGSVVDSVAHIPFGEVSATVGGLPAEVVFVGAAPQAIAGLLQVNVRIPLNALPGDDIIVITIGGVSSQSGVTVAVSGWF